MMHTALPESSFSYIYYVTHFRREGKTKRYGALYREEKGIVQRYVTVNF